MKLIPHVLKAVIIVLLVPVMAAAATHTVNQVGFTFSPAEITIEVGDTVDWVWSAGSHTVTSGTDLSDPDVGVLFDTPLNSGAPSFSYTFTEAGVQDYFCRPHLGRGMVGTVNVMAVSAVGDAPSSVAMRLQPNVPNPFNPSTKISFELPADREGPVAVSLQVFDLKGRLVRTLVDRTLTADNHTATWNGRDRRGQAVPAGVYFYRLDAGGQSLTRSMTLVK